ncbi:MAG: insulinase family protein [Bacteriovorax sp.]|nr:insulinase family protein [Bacteriovorax sp.]
MKTTLLMFTVLLFSVKSFAVTKVENTIKRLNWNGIDVVYIEDNRFPTYDLLVYFADGALSDVKGQLGATKHAFNLLDAGTAKLSQKDILDQFEFLGTEFGVDVTHEYSTLSMSGLSKDLATSMTQTCDLLREANFPAPIIKQELDKERSELQSLVASPQALADRVFREVSLGNTPYSYPVTGKLHDLDLYTPEVLRAKVSYFLDKVKKRIYLTGPKSILSVEKILAEKCKFKGGPSDFVRSIAYKKQKRSKTEIVFIPVPDANQVQVQIGRFLNFDEIGDRRLDTLATEFLGGGFTSRLMREVRVKRGLTYSIGSYISSQKQYGRSGISTFTKNETINKLIEVINDAVEKIKKEGISQEDLERSRGAIVGAHPFKFESNRAFLAQLLYLDHIERPYAELFDFNQAVMKYTTTDVSKKIEDVFGTNSQIIFVLGDKSIEKELKKLSPKLGKMKVLDYKSFI